MKNIWAQTAIRVCGAELFHALSADGFGAVDQHSEAREVERFSVTGMRTSPEELQCEIRDPAECASILGDKGKHGCRLNDPIRRRLHHDVQMSSQWQHETRNQTHVVIERKPTIDLVFLRQLKRLSEMLQLCKHA